MEIKLKWRGVAIAVLAVIGAISTQIVVGKAVAETRGAIVETQQESMPGTLG